LKAKAILTREAFIGKDFIFMVTSVLFFNTLAELHPDINGKTPT